MSLRAIEAGSECAATLGEEWRRREEVLAEARARPSRADRRSMPGREPDTAAFHISTIPAVIHS